MNPRQTQELAKTYMDLGKLIIASFLLGFFQFKEAPVLGIVAVIVGLTFSVGFFILGLRMFKELS